MERITYYFVGLDLGQAMDYTALAVAEQVQDTLDDRLGFTRPEAEAKLPVYDVRHLERFALGTSYPVIVERVRDLLNFPLLARKPVRLLVDDTGVGGPVVNLLRQANLSVHPVRVTLTAGVTPTGGGSHYGVPKRDLISATKVLLQSERLRFAEELPETPTLIKELLAYQPKIDAQPADNVAAWREGIYDDLVLAVAMICWDAVTHYHGPRRAPEGPRDYWAPARRR